MYTNVTNGFGKPTATVTQQKEQLTIRIYRVYSRAVEIGKKGAHREGSVSFRREAAYMIRSSDGRRGDQRSQAAPLQTRKEAKVQRDEEKDTMCFHSFSLFPAQEDDGGEEIERERKRGRSSRRVRRQPVTNLTLNQLTCARTHKRTPVHTSARSLDAELLACNMCNIMYAMPPFRMLSGGAETCIRRLAK